jgi:hypothetical protein
MFAVAFADRAISEQIVANTITAVSLVVRMEVRHSKIMAFASAIVHQAIKENIVKLKNAALEQIVKMAVLLLLRMEFAIASVHHAGQEHFATNFFVFAIIVVNIVVRISINHFCSLFGFFIYFSLIYYPYNYSKSIFEQER